MQVPNFDNHLFRCSASGILMTGASVGLSERQTARFAELDARYKGLGKALTPNMMAEHAKLLFQKTQPPKLSTTVETYLQQVFREEVFGRVKEINTKEMTKGTVAEEHSLSLYSDVQDRPFGKNEERKTNEYLTGECDNVTDIIRDIKTSWDLYTFPFYGEKFPSKVYWWQLQCYMELWKKQKAELIYCLVNTPEMQITDEKFKVARYAPEMEITPEMEAQIELNMTFDDIPKELRVRVFKCDYDPEAIKSLYAQLDLCRDYLNGLSEDLRLRLAS